MKHLSLLISAVLVAGTVVAQRNYVPGTVITHQNDSLKGFIDYQNWSISPGEIRFKSQLENAREEHFKPTDINGFVISQPEEVYVSRKVLLDITNQSLAHLMETGVRDIQDSTVFLSRLVKGFYSLYDYIDIYNRTHYIYEKEGEIPQELLMQKAYVTNSRGSGVFEDKAYQQQLGELFTDNSGISRKGRSATYEEKPLKNLFIAYNSYKDPAFAPKEETKRIKHKIYFGLMAGLSSSTYRPSGEAVVFRGTYEGSTWPLLGVWADIPAGRNRRRFSFPIEAHYKSITTDGIVHLYNGVLTRFAFDYVQVNVMLRYTYPKGFIRPYINAGLGNAFMLKVRKNDKSTDGGKQWSEAIEGGPRKLEQGLIAGIGATISRFGIEGRYVGSNGFSPYASSGIGIRSLQLIATCRL